MHNLNFMETQFTTIILEESEGIDRINEPVTVGIPFPIGFVQDASNLNLQDPEGNHIPLQTQVLTNWPDGSSKWVLFDFQASVEADTIRELTVDESETASEKPFQISVEENKNDFLIDTKAASFLINTKVFKPFDRVVVRGKDILDGQESRTVLTDESGAEYEPVIHKLFFETEGPLRTTLKAEGTFGSRGESAFVSFFARISFFANCPMARIEFTILNPNAAKHPGGLWDLGDSGSIFFDDLSLHTTLNARGNTKIIWTTQPAACNSQPATRNLVVYQDSSGGENWNSKNHLNRNNEVRNSFKGYKVYSNGEDIEAGTRANPSISITGDDKEISGTVQYFWQNFPKGLEANDNTLTIKLFPKQYNDVFELQGGEQKTHTVFLNFGDSQCLRGLVQSPLIPRSTPEWYAKTKAFHYLIPEIGDPNNELKELINTAIKGNNTFFHRREIIDEYGWRNFGELYADHEAIGHKGAEPLISHYNNQYDCIYGLLIQFVRSGDIRWLLLAEQLCSHAKDIDIYHTDADRPEYNHGLFWHTEHYIDAQTATHRCFSKKHAAQRNMAAYGGGPALSHNYSSGFLCHYYMTGTLSSREAVLELASFIINNMDMAGTLSSRFIKKLRKIRVSLKNMLGKGELVELGKVYEFDGPGRAGGNALNTLVDAYALTGHDKYLSRAEDLIFRCIHPNDNIEKRDLPDVENRWMYTVFLQSLGKYLDMKMTAGEVDAVCQYARLSIIHYAKWMAENEYPYLDKPDKLEYPNETWAAQDLRKSNVFKYAAKYSENPLRQLFLDKSEFFFKEAIRYLFSFDKTKTLTRPLALLMTNGFIQGAFATYSDETKDVAHKESGQMTDTISLSQNLIWKFSLIYQIIRNISLKKEWLWIKYRLGR